MTDPTATPSAASTGSPPAETALIDALERHAKTRADSLAIRERSAEGERHVSWAELRDAAAQVRDRLGPSDDSGAVMIASANRVELLAAILGGLWAGRAVMPVPPELPAPERASLARRAGVTTAMGDASLLDALSGLVPSRFRLELHSGDSRPGAATSRPAEGSVLLGSSGTTGMPKIVRRRSAALAAVGENCRRAIGIDESDRMLLAIPLYHSYGIDLGVLTAIIAGCEVELHDRFDPARVCESMAERGITLLPAVPLMLDALARAARHGGRAPQLRRVFSAGSPLPARVARAFREGFGVPVGQIYGATEFGSVGFNDPELPGYDPEQVGHPMAGVEFRILHPEKPRVGEPLPVGEEGQVAVASPSLLSEYVDSDEAPTVDGFLLPGDLGRLDERGVLTLTGRVKLLIDIGALKVNPLEIEAVLAQHPGVSEVIVVPLPYSDTASRLKAVVVPEPDVEIDPASLRAFARKQLIHYKVPRRFEITRDVPRSPTGKILRQKLQPAANEGGAE